MRTDVALNGSSSPTSNYIGWTPSPAEIRLSDSTGGTGPVTVTLRNKQPGVGGQVVFSTAFAQLGQSELDLVLPSDGSPVAFFAAGNFLFAPSVADQDAAIEVIDKATGMVLSETRLMVRVRKNANNLTPAERDRFIAAFATFNDKGMGRFSEFRNMHRDGTLSEAHGFHGFLPWHRAYLLDLERELQAIDASVALHYWRFDEKAPNLFTEDFLGVTDDPMLGTVRFSSGNLFQFWRTDGGDTFNRAPRFNPLTEAASGLMGPVLNQTDTLKLGLPGDTYDGFVRMEGQPHGAAHVSFSGFIRRPHLAPKDPLFFLLHSNVERLWAMWQWLKKRFDVSVAGTYRFLGSAGGPAPVTRVGHNFLDTMWPWNGEIGAGNPDDRPVDAPGGGLARSPFVSSPPAAPTVGDMMDYQGKVAPANRQGFDYDDVPYQP